MKKLIALTLCGAMIAAPLDLNAVPKEPGPNEPQSAVMAICLVGGGAIVGGVVIWMLKTCRPKYYCVKDEDGNVFPSNASRTERAANDWSVQSGPYTSAAAAAAACPPKTNSVQTISAVGATVQSADNPGVYIPAIPIKIWKSTNLVDWVLRDTITDDPSHFSWSETNTASTTAAFYKASY